MRNLLLIGLLLVSSSVFSQNSSQAPASNTKARIQQQVKRIHQQLSAFVARRTYSVAALEEDLAAERTRGQGHGAWEFQDAHLYWLRQRAYPNDTINWMAYVRAFVQLASMPKFRVKSPPGLAAVPQPRWEFEGPTNLPVPYRQYYGEGMTSGRVNDAAFDPNDDKTLYVASAGGGLWKSSDQGQTWKPLSDNGLWDNTTTSSVAISPDNSQIIYAGTGDFNGGVGVYGFGIMKSNDGGGSWTNLARSELKGFSVSRILVHPDDPKVVIAAAGRNPFGTGKLLRSANSGTSWSTVDMSKISGGIEADWTDVKCGIPDGQHKRLCFAVGEADGGELLRTADEGIHWERLHPPLSSVSQLGLSITVSPNSSDTLYLLSGTDKKVLKGTAGGNMWKDITNNLPSYDQIKKGYNWSQSSYDFAIQAAKLPGTDKDVIYVGLIDLVASVDDGAHWLSVGRTVDEDALTHNDQHCLTVDPKDANSLLVGNDGGIYLAHYKPNLSQWSFDDSLNARLGLTQFYKIAVDPNDMKFIYGGAQDNATPISEDNLANWSNIGGGDGGFVAINPANSQIQYASGQYLNVFRTEKRWKDWDPGYESSTTDPDFNISYQVGSVRWLGDPISFLAPLVLDPHDPNILYAGSNYLWKWDERTKKWESHLGGQMLAQDAPPSAPNETRDAISVIAVASSNSQVLYTGSLMGQLWVSMGGGKPNSWKRIDGGGTVIPTYSITSVVVHPTNSGTILVGLSGTGDPVTGHPGHLWKCTGVPDHTKCQNLTGTGTGKLPDVPVNAAVIDPNTPDKVYYVATDIGVFMTKDGGVTWGDATKPFGLPQVQVNDLQLIADSLFAGTFGRGVWRIDGLANATLQPRRASPALHNMSTHAR
jgi:photosystem II stability/assembly factor-like uncharacterized protein